MLIRLKFIDYLALISIVVLVCIFSPSVYADTSIGRYLTVSSQPLSIQVNVLSQQFQGRFPSTVKTVGDAMQYLLQVSGYELVPYSQQPADIAAMLQKPLPAIDRQLGPIALNDALTTLAGEPFQLLVDPVHRLIAFRLKPFYTNRFKING